MDVVSKEYKDLLQERYKQPGWGGSGYSWAGHVRYFAVKLGAKSILDYGCGRGTLKPALPLFDVREYDPGIVGKDGEPMPADLVVCTDVLEHIEPDRLSNVFAHLKSLARLGMFLNIGLGPAKEVLPDGRNAHLINKSPEWWLRALFAAGITPFNYERKKGLVVTVKVL